MKKDFISIKDLTRQDIEDIFKLADQLKKQKGINTPLAGKSMGMIFQKPSNRTRVSFEVGMAQLGGHAIYLGPESIKLGVREKTGDIAKTLSRYLDVILARVFSHNDIIELAVHSTIPVINGLSDLLHPCQAMTDIYTIKEKAGRLKGIKLAYVGDGNNVLHSLMNAAIKTGIKLSIATPKKKKYQPSEKILNKAQCCLKGDISISHDSKEAVKDADFVYTDVWASMGQEKEAKKRKKAFKGFTIDAKLLSQAKKECFVMHCLPAHRGEEITDEVIDGPKSIVFDQAENRLHVQKAILLWLLKSN